jgi:aspartyl-tRNA(Asn)/glutamyl-tRNA(Gln) amidotransferase subunit B
MEEGSLRVDANVSVRRAGDTELGTRCEVKNLNSIRSLGRAIEYEARRQIDLLEAGERVRQETRHWNEDDGRTHTLRSKEEADDYRYFPEPDLVPLDPDGDWIQRIANELPPLPAERRRRLAEAAGAEPAATAVAVAVGRDLDALALAAIGEGADPRRVLTHVEQNLAGEQAASLDPHALAALVGLETGGQLTATQAKDVLARLVTAGGGGDPAAIAADLGYRAMSGDELAKVVDDAIAAEPDAWAKYATGDDRAKGALVGWIMRATSKQADGKAVGELLDARRRAAS